MIFKNKTFSDKGRVSETLESFSIILCLFCFIMPAVFLSAQSPWEEHGSLKAEKHYLVYDDGTPFFYMGDTNWAFLMGATREDAVKLIENRRKKGFTVLQTVLTGVYLKREEVVPKPNVYGDFPFENFNISTPKTTPGSDFNNEDQYDYWDHVDFIVSEAESKGIYLGLLLGWDKLYLNGMINVDNARDYARWVGERYKDSPNIIWILGGDTRPNSESAQAVFEEMAIGLKEGDQGNHLMTFHSNGGTSSSQWFHNKDWLDFNMLQTGHAAYDLPNHEKISADYLLQPVKPTMDGESRYEDHSVNWNPENGWFNDFDVRQGAYWSLFAGALGHTYGTRGVWQMYRPGIDKRGPLTNYWYDAMDLPGGEDMKHVRDLIFSRDILSRIPDQSLVKETYSKADYIQATRGKGYAFIYVPTGKNFKVNLKTLGAKSMVHAWWYNPRDGLCYDSKGKRIDMPFKIIKASKNSVKFNPPGSPERGNDWVLVLDDSSFEYAAPGKEDIHIHSK